MGSSNALHSFYSIGVCAPSSSNRGRRLTADVSAQSAKAKQREDAQRAEALKMDEMLIQIKSATDQVNADSEKAQIQANAPRIKKFRPK